MSEYTNNANQPIGFPLADWQAAEFPPRLPLNGRYAQLEPLEASKHAEDLFEAYSVDDKIWTYLPYGPFDSLAAFAQWLVPMTKQKDPIFFAILDAKSKKAIGVASYLRISPLDGVIEVGHINYSPFLQKTPAATEAMYLMMRYVFDTLAYRRYEWKCDALNTGSQAAARRLGFQYEGTFRQATIYKGRNRDTAWYSILDSEWPVLKASFEAWLEPENFDLDGNQKASLQFFVGENLKKE